MTLTRNLRDRLRSSLGAVILLCVGAVGAAQAESSVTVGDYTVHFNALSTLDLSPEMARSYSISRSENRALLNIAVRHVVGETDDPASAKLSGEAVNDAGQRQTLYFREVRESGAIYYLSEPPVRPGDTWRFELTVEVEGGPKVPLRFSQRFFAPLPKQR